jgi:uncharacterized protein
VALTIERLLSRGARPVISLTVTRHNAPELADAVRFLLQRDLPFNLNFVRDPGDEQGGAELIATDEALIHGLRQALTAIEQQLPDRSLLGNLLDRAQFYYPHDRSCSAGVSYLAVGPGGAVSKCQMELERPVATIWTQDLLTAVRDETQGLQNPSVDQRRTCRSCTWRYWCGGGCPLQAQHGADGLAGASPYCRVYRAVFPDLLRLEGLRLVKMAQRRQLAM